jgi:hypothetical protein
MTVDDSGKRFSLVYLTTDEALQDSKRARVRVAWLLDKVGIPSDELADKVESTLGVKLPTTMEGYYLPAAFVEKCALRDFLDLISLVWRGFQDNPHVERFWLDRCRKIFAEEHLRYVINDAGGVRFSADADFEKNVQATIQGLGHSSLKGALAAYDHCLEALSRSPPEGKSAVRSVFEAVEIVFKTLCAGARGRPPRIGGGEIKDHLNPRLDSIYTEPIARQAAKKLAASLVDWVESAHVYRHGQASEEPVEPPFELAVTLVSEGSSFLRWLAVLHQRLNAGDDAERKNPAA